MTRLVERINRWAAAGVKIAAATILFLIAITIAASYFTDVSNTTQTIKDLTPPAIKLIGGIQ